MSSEGTNMSSDQPLELRAAHPGRSPSHTAGLSHARGCEKQKLRFHIFDYLKNIPIQISIGFKDGELSGYSASFFKQKTP